MNATAQGVSLGSGLNGSGQRTGQNANRQALARRAFENDNTGNTNGGPGGVTGAARVSLKPKTSAPPPGFIAGARRPTIRALTEGPMQLRRMRRPG